MIHDSMRNSANSKTKDHHQDHELLVVVDDVSQCLYRRQNQQQHQLIDHRGNTIIITSRPATKNIDSFRLLQKHKLQFIFCVALIAISLFYMGLLSHMIVPPLDYNSVTKILLRSDTTNTMTSEVISYGPPGWSDVKLAIYMSSHFPEQHELFLPCWNDAVQRMDIFKYADLILFTSSQNTTQHTQFLPFRKIIIKKYINNGYQEGAFQAMINPFLEKVSWFDQYDWVIRLNADVLIKDDKWLIQTMLNPSIDGIFHDCLNRKDFPDRPIIQSDFNAFRPKALDREMILAASQHFTAEFHLSSAFRNIYESKKFAWVEGANNSVPGTCRIEGMDSPVVHVHSMATACPYYYNSTLQNVK